MGLYGRIEIDRSWSSSYTLAEQGAVGLCGRIEIRPVMEFELYR